MIMAKAPPTDNPTVKELAQRNWQLTADVQKLSKEVYGALEFL
jgi:hypothetical protein